MTIRKKRHIHPGAFAAKPANEERSAMGVDVSMPLPPQRVDNREEMIMGQNEMWKFAAATVDFPEMQVGDVRGHVCRVAHQCGSRYMAVTNGTNWPFSDPRARLMAKVWLLHVYLDKGTCTRAGLLLRQLRQECETLPRKQAVQIGRVLGIAEDRLDQKMAERAQKVLGSEPLSQKELYGRAGRSVPPPPNAYE